MAKFKVTLKAKFNRGEMYWVSTVDARDEDDAMNKAETGFFAELDNPSEWAFDEADVEAG
jgi:hypothetical protein